jgi:hypothetical protein
VLGPEHPLEVWLSREINDYLSTISTTATPNKHDKICTCEGSQMFKIWLVPITVSGAIFIFPPATANAGLCDYPAVLTGATVFFSQGAYCDLAY